MKLKIITVALLTPSLALAELAPPYFRAVNPDPKLIHRDLPHHEYLNVFGNNHGGAGKIYSQEVDNSFFGLIKEHRLLVADYSWALTSGEYTSTPDNPQVPFAVTMSCSARQTVTTGSNPFQSSIAISPPWVSFGTNLDYYAGSALDTTGELAASNQLLLSGRIFMGRPGRKLRPILVAKGAHDLSQMKTDYQAWADPQHIEEDIHEETEDNPFFIRAFAFNSSVAATRRAAFAKQDLPSSKNWVRFGPSSPSFFIAEEKKFALQFSLHKEETGEQQQEGPEEMMIGTILGFTPKVVAVTNGYGVASSSARRVVHVEASHTMDFVIEWIDAYSDLDIKPVDPVTGTPGLQGPGNPFLTKWQKWNGTEYETVDEIGGFFSSSGSNVSLDVPAGTYSILVKSKGCLAKRFGGIVAGTGSDQNQVRDYFQFSGDINEDNSIDLLDAFALSDHYLKTADEPSFDVPDENGISPSDADLNGDGSVDLLDYFLISNNYNMVGDE